jgi:hypothetical protein
MEKVTSFLFSFHKALKVDYIHRADEVHVETMKDNNTAQNLLEEIETAKMQHPTSRQSSSFVSRADVLAKRLYSRGNPAASYSTFPCPIHPLFPDQQASNEALTQLLSSEIATTMELAKKVMAIAEEYRTTYEAVKFVEVLSETADGLSSQYETIINQLTKGIVVNDGDGSPPDLSTASCLEPSRHASFLALFPSVVRDLSKVNRNADQVLQSSRSALLGLMIPGIDSSLKARVTSEFQRLGSLRAQSQEVSDNITVTIDQLRDARRIWGLIGDRVQKFGSFSLQIRDAMERQRWRKQSGGGGTPLTPESPAATVHPTYDVPVQISELLDSMGSQLSHEIDLPLKSMAQSLEVSLHGWLSSRVLGLERLLESIQQMAQLLENIKGQAAVMASIRDQFEDVQIRTENLRIQFDAVTQDVLVGKLAGVALTNANAELNSSSQQLRNDVQTFIEGLTHRVVFVDRAESASHPQTKVVKARLTSSDLELAATQRIAIELPFELSSLDDDVRADSNSYVMRLSGELQNLDRKRDHLHLSQMARDLDAALSSTVNCVNGVVQEFMAYKHSLSSALEQGGGIETIQSLSKDFEEFSRINRQNIARSFSPVRDLLHQIDYASSSQDKSLRDGILLSRGRAVDDAEVKFNAWNEDVASFKEQLIDAGNLSRIGDDIDADLRNNVETINGVVEELRSFKAVLSSIKEQGNEKNRLRILQKDFEAFSQTNRSNITGSFSFVRELLGQMQSTHPAAQEIMVLTRNEAVAQAESMFNAWNEDMASFAMQILEAQHLSQLADDVDASLLSTLARVDHAVRKLASFELSLSAIMEQGYVVEPLRSLSSDFEVFSHGHSSIAYSLSPIRDVLRQMDVGLGPNDNALRETIYLARASAVGDAELKVNAWKEAMKSFDDRISEIRRAAEQRLEEEFNSRAEADDVERLRMERQRSDTTKLKVGEPGVEERHHEVVTADAMENPVAEENLRVDRGEIGEHQLSIHSVLSSQNNPDEGEDGFSA